MQNLPILIDQDGVAADFVRGLYHTLQHLLRPDEFEALPDPHSLATFYIEDCVATGNPRLDEKLKAVIREIVDDHPSMFLGLPEMPGAKVYMNMLKERAAAEGMDVLLCTAPHAENRSCHSDKAWWAGYHLGKPWAKHMIMTHDKTLVQGLVLVDDKPVITGRLQPTWQHIVFDAAYNRTVHGPRVSGWNEQTVDYIMDFALKSQLVNGLR